MADGPRTTVTFDASVFGPDAIKKAAYTIAAQASVDIRHVGTEWVCGLQFLKPALPALVDEIAESFRIEVLDQDLRERIAAETGDVRNSILAVAFSKTGLQGDG